MKSLRYLWYIIRHKAFVFKGGLKTGAPIWLLVIHDWSKFLPGEFVPYRNFFQTDDAKRTAEQKAAFLKAWEIHWKRNPHHWNYWSEDCEWLPGVKRNYAMPECYVREMVADWLGAGRAIKGYWDVRHWYEENKNKIELHEDTRNFVEWLIDQVSPLAVA